jgi:hypothetical protein
MAGERGGPTPEEVRAAEKEALRMEREREAALIRRQQRRDREGR